MNDSQSKRIEFTRAQVAYLETTFPEMIGTPKTPSEELVWRAAQRSVILFIKGKQTNQEV